MSSKRNTNSNKKSNTFINSLINSLSLSLRPLDTNKYKMIIDDIDQAFLFVNLSSGNIIDTNLLCLKLLEYSRSEILSITIEQIIDNQNQNSINSLTTDIHPGTRKLWKKVPIRTRSGNIRDFNIRSIVDAHNKTIMLLILEEVFQKEKIYPYLELSKLTTLMQFPDDDSVIKSASICKTFLGSDQVSIYKVGKKPGFKLLTSSSNDNLLPKYVDATDNAISTTTYSWKNGDITKSIFSQVARQNGFEHVIVQPLGDKNSCTGLLIAMFKDKEIDTDISIKISIIAKLLNSLLELGGHWKSAAIHSNEIETLEQNWQTLMATTVDGILSVNTEGVISRANELSGVLLGYDVNEMTTMQLSDVLIASPPVVDTIHKHLNENKNYSSPSITLIRRDGQEINVFLRSVPIYDNENNLSGGLIAINDNSAQQAMKAKTQHLEQRALLGDLSAIFAHEIRNPLNGISTGLQYLQMQLQHTDPLQETVESILEEAVRINRLLEDILLIVKPTELKIEGISIKDCLNSIVERWRERLSSRNISINIEHVANTPLVLADQIQIEQVATNLISNAMHAMEPDGGAITISIQPLSQEITEMRGDHVSINIADTGPGMTQEVVDRIFDPFYTTKQSGTGLGLAISQRIITAHRGTITVQSWPTVGTIFTIILPAAT